MELLPKRTVALHVITTSESQISCCSVKKVSPASCTTSRARKEKASQFLRKSTFFLIKYCKKGSSKIHKVCDIVITRVSVRHCLLALDTKEIRFMKLFKIQTICLQQQGDTGRHRVTQGDGVLTCSGPPPRLWRKRWAPQSLTPSQHRWW